MVKICPTLGMGADDNGDEDYDDEVFKCHCDPLTALEIAAEEGKLDVCKFIIENAKEETLPDDRYHTFYYTHSLL